MVRVILFSGGRGSSGLSQRLVTDSNVELTIAINGYDDGASTGRVRRFLGDCLGPSDFRKNASHLSRQLNTCPEAASRLLDWRLPMGCSAADAAALLAPITVNGERPSNPPIGTDVATLVAQVGSHLCQLFAKRLALFEAERQFTGRLFDYSDCAIGNLVFAGSFLHERRLFNAAVDDYCRLLGLRPGLIANVTDGTNAYLVAVDTQDRLLSTEEAIVDAKQRNQIRDIYLIDRPLTADEELGLATEAAGERSAFLARRSQSVALNPALALVLQQADLIVYAPGTQHSSLFPSYLTRGLSGAISRNLTAIKLLVTNIQTDAEIAGSSAVDIVERAVFYLKEKGTLRTPTPALLTHYLLNEPVEGGVSRSYVPLGRIDALDDPRLVRIGHYEDRVTGRHDASKILEPFLSAFLSRERRPQVGVILHDVGSSNKLCQTLIEMIRGGIRQLNATVHVFYAATEPLDPEYARLLPFPVTHLGDVTTGWNTALRRSLDQQTTDFVVLFESSGMYRGEDVVALLSPLLSGRFDAVWGSRRLSARDIEESYRLRYRHRLLLGLMSAAGSQLLSLACLLFYGRYISDTLSGARALRYGVFRAAGVELADKRANHQLLAMLLGRKAEIQEVYVRFVALSPDRVKRTTVMDGLAALYTIVARRFSRSTTRPQQAGARPPE